MKWDTWPISRIGGVIFLLTVVGIMAYGLSLISTYMKDEQQAPVQVIAVSGDFEFIDIAELEAQIRRSQPGSFFELDVQSVHALIEAHPWVYRASVRKKWPHTLQVYLIEQTPVASWNDDMWLNPFGEAFAVTLDNPSLPALYGPGGSETTALEGYQAMQQLLTLSGLKIKALSLSERYAWQVQLADGIRLNLGRQEFMDRLQRFVDVHPLLMKNERSVSYVDLRYDTGLAVGWHDNNNNNEEKVTDV